MTVTLYQNLSESNYVNKTLASEIPITGNMVNASSVLNPVILVKAESAGIVLSNYMLIHEWQRYYFITDIISVRQGLWEIHGHVDVLMTFKNQFLRLSAIVARQEYLYNLYLDDDKFLINAPRQYVTKAFPNRAVSNELGGRGFVLTVAGGASSQGEASVTTE